MSIQRFANVVPMRPGNLCAEDTEIIETMMLLATGREVATKEMEFSRKTLDAIEKDMGKPYSYSRGYRFPMVRWDIANTSGEVVSLLVIDQGEQRVFYYSAQTGVAVPALSSVLLR